MTQASPVSDGSAFFVETLPLIDGTIRFVCRRHHCCPDEAEEFASIARLRLIEDDYAVLRKFGGRCKLGTYLGVVIGRMFLDFRRQRWGVWRPSAEARRLGPVAVRLDILLHRDGVSLDEAIEMLRTNERVAAAPGEMETLAARLPRRAGRRATRDAMQAAPILPAETVERAALHDERDARARRLRMALHDALRSLPAEDALILRLRFQDDFTIGRIAESLHVDAKPLYRRIGNLLADLRAILAARGFEGADLYDALGLSAWDDDEEGA